MAGQSGGLPVGAVTVSERGGSAPLSDVMMAMDVVDTLRHRETLVERELAGPDREAALLDRLREVYRSQGIEVPDRILLEGVAALQEERFAYRPPAPGLGVSLARLYVRRHFFARVAAAALVVLALGAGGWFFGIELPARREAEAVRIEFAATLPAALDGLLADIGREAEEEGVRARARRLADQGQSAIRERNLPAARDMVAALTQLRADLRQTYEVRIVSRPGEQTGITRAPPRNPAGRNYYVVVEAIGPDGRPLSRTIRNEEDGTQATVSQWAQRVPRSTFEAVRADKADDGIVQRSLLGVKRAGALEPVWRMPVDSGAITAW